jgi:diguanylate cyclase (GGDEF)-like protein
MQSNASTARSAVIRLASLVGAGRTAQHLSLDDHRLMRVVGSLQYAGSGLMLLSLLAMPDPDSRDHFAYVLLAAFGLLAAILRWSTQRSSLTVARATNFGCIVYVGVVVSVSRPIGPASFLMLWPLLSTAYFLGRRDLAAALGTMALLLFGALRVNDATGDDLTLQLLPVTAIIAFASVLMSVLRERLDHLIGDLERSASTDGLTGLPNRRAWNAAFDREIERAQRTGIPLSIAVFDLDRFKAINDCLGHAEGDRALVRFSNLIATECRSFDLPGRLGGEEFGLLLVGANAEGAAAFAERLRGRLELVTQHDETPFTVSTGVAEFGVHADTPDAMMLAADRALYRAKDEGRDRVVVADLPPLARAEASDGEAPLDALDALGQSAEQLSLSVTLKLEPQPQAATTFGFSTLNPAPVIASTKSITDPST